MKEAVKAANAEDERLYKYYSCTCPRLTPPSAVHAYTTNIANTILHYELQIYLNS